MKVVRILHPWLPEYRLPFFKELISLGKNDDIDYQIFAGETPPDSSGRKDALLSTSQFTVLKTKKVLIGGRSLLLHKVDSTWNKVDLIITEYAIRNLVTYKWLFSKRKNPVAIWGHGRTYTKQNTKIEEWLKNSLTKRSYWFFGYTALGVESVIATGFPRERTTTVMNSTDTSKLIRYSQSVTDAEIQKFKNDLQINSVNVAVFIGALDASKRLDFLVQSATQIEKEVQDFQLLIYGDGPEHANLVNATRNLPFIKICGRANLKTQSLISKIAKVILMPGRVGLIAVDSFALGLPIITTDWPWHAPEFEYLIDGFNSIISKDDIENYSESVVALLNDVDKLARLKNQCLEDAKIYTIESMANNFHRGVLDALNSASNIKRVN